MDTITAMTDAELAREYRDLDNLVYVVECYSTGDMRRLAAIEAELQERGYSLELTNNKWTIERWNDQDEHEKL